MTRRDFLSATAGLGSALCLSDNASTAADRRSSFTILHTNDIHSHLIGLGPASDYSTDSLNDDMTLGGLARLAAKIQQRRSALEHMGPVLILDAGDYSMGTAFGAAIRETGGELQLLSHIGYDAITFGNHDFDLGPEGLADSIRVAVEADRVPGIVASNTRCDADDASLQPLRQLVAEGIIRRHIVIERQGLRFGIFGVMGRDSIFYTTGAGSITFDDAIRTAHEMVDILRQQERVDVIICLSHGGLEKDSNGNFIDGDDVRLAQAVPGIDVVIGGHTHTALKQPIFVNGRTPVVQAGEYGRHLGELQLELLNGRLRVTSSRLHPIDDTIPGDDMIAGEVNGLRSRVTDAVFASRGYRIDQPLARLVQDLPNTSADLAASTPLANLITDAFRKVSRADIGFNANGLMRTGFTRGTSGILTVYDVFAVAPLGAGVVDATAGSPLVTGYFTGHDLRQLLEFMLEGSPAYPGDYFPRVSGMRFCYDLSRPRFDKVTAIEIGDLDQGYQPIGFTEHDPRLYSVASSLYLGLMIVAIPQITQGRLNPVPKNKDGHPLMSTAEALALPRGNSPYMLPAAGRLDSTSIASVMQDGRVREIKEWQAIMDYLRSLPTDHPGELPTIAVDNRATEARAIRVG